MRSRLKQINCECYLKLDSYNSKSYNPKMDNESRMQFKIGDIVLAQCENYPYWPGKIITILANINSYKVLFYGEKSQATIHQSYIMHFNEEMQRKVINQGNNRNNKNLRNSMNIALRKYHRRKKGLASSSEDDDFFQESELPRRLQAIEPEPKTKPKTLPNRPTEDPHVELGVLLNSLSNQAANFRQAKEKVIRFTPENEVRLRALLEPGAVSLLGLIQNRTIEKMIVVLKELDLWGLTGFGDLHQVVKAKYQQFKAAILSQEFQNLPLREARKEIIVQKVLKNKAVL